MVVARQDFAPKLLQTCRVHLHLVLVIALFHNELDYLPTIIDYRSDKKWFAILSEVPREFHKNRKRRQKIQNRESIFTRSFDDIGLYFVQVSDLQHGYSVHSWTGNSHKLLWNQNFTCRCQMMTPLILFFFFIILNF